MTALQERPEAVPPGSTHLHDASVPADLDAAAVDEEPAAAARGVSASEAQLALWIGRMVGRDERALAAFYDATLPRVYKFVLRIVRRTALADEVVEETYYQAWRQASRFDGARAGALTWLLAIARSRAIDALRHEARFDYDTLDDESARAATSPSPAADEMLDSARRRTELFSALQQLGAQSRQLVVLAFFRGLSHEEIAAHTQLPLGTVKSQIRRGLITLRRLLGETVAQPQSTG